MLWELAFHCVLGTVGEQIKSRTRAGKQPVLGKRLVALGVLVLIFRSMMGGLGKICGFRVERPAIRYRVKLLVNRTA